MILIMNDEINVQYFYNEVSTKINIEMDTHTVVYSVLRTVH